mgnify:CR=1 FL=1
MILAKIGYTVKHAKYGTLQNKAGEQATLDTHLAATSILKLAAAYSRGALGGLTPGSTRT